MLENLPNKTLKENTTEQRDLRKEIKDFKPAPNFGLMKFSSSSSSNIRSYAEFGICCSVYPLKCHVMDKFSVSGSLVSTG